MVVKYLIIQILIIQKKVINLHIIKHKMKSGISFQELAKLQTEQLSKQRPITLEIALEQKRRIEARRKENFKKRIA